MAITTAFCTSAKVDLLNGRHHFALSGGDTFKLALIKTSEAGTYGAGSTSYANISGNGDDPTVGGGGSSSPAVGAGLGGGTLTRVDPTSSGTTAYTSFSNLVFTLTGASASLAANGCMIYNDTLTTPVADAAVSVHAFSGSPSASGNGATFTIQFPAADASNAILRLA